MVYMKQNICLSGAHWKAIRWIIANILIKNQLNIVNKKIGNNLNLINH